MGLIFNENEERFITENYHCMTNKQIVDAIGHTENQVRGYANHKGLKKENSNVKHAKWKTDYIMKWYNVKSNNEIADYVGLSSKQVNDYGYRHVGKLDTYVVDDTFFEIIDTEEKAYWLGFLYADGCVLDYKNKPTCKFKSLELALAECDKDHIYKMLKDMKATYPVRKGCANGYIHYKTNISNTKICDDLINLGCVPRKSLVLKFPTCDIVPERLVKHFIRGYFDGDGCVSYSSPTAKRKAYVVGFVGTYDMSEKIKDILYESVGLTKIKLQKCGNAFQFQWGGRGNCKKLYDYLYEDATVWLDRKYEKLTRIINYEV